VQILRPEQRMTPGFVPDVNAALDTPAVVGSDVVVLVTAEALDVIGSALRKSFVGEVVDEDAVAGIASAWS
jgi:hypothetical protein